MFLPSASIRVGVVSAKMGAESANSILGKEIADRDVHEKIHIPERDMLQAFHRIANAQGYEEEKVLDWCFSERCLSERCANEFFKYSLDWSGGACFTGNDYVVPLMGKEEEAGDGRIIEISRRGPFCGG